MDIDPIVVDFETFGIDGNPIINPPKAVGVAVWVPGHEPTYLAFGHPAENNCTWAAAHEYLKRLSESGQPLLFHNCGFDISVWEASFGNAVFKGKWWELIHDTQYLLFLADPYAASYSLKPSALRHLDMSPDEQDNLKNWILDHVPEATAKSWGAFICRAPGDLVGEYAIGDVVRTRRLFDKLYPQIVEQGMLAAYERERRVFPILYEGTKRGIKIDREALEHHETVYTQCLSIANSRLSSILRVDDVCALSDDAFANALENINAVTEWTHTATGKRSLARGNLKISNPEVKVLYEYRAILETCLQTFMRPWLDYSRSSGRLHPNWNQVRMDRDARNTKGTRTGRLSSDSPNFQNVPTEFSDITGAPVAVPTGLHPPPLMRQYCLPEYGHLWVKRDFSSQEIRILAHFEDGTLCEAYRANPRLDPHEMARQMISGLTGVLYARGDIKITGFSIIYGTGASGLSVQLGQPIEVASQIKSAYFAAMPAIRNLMDDIQRRGRSGSPIRTWGGRLYYTEAPGFSKKYNRVMTYEYKLLNYLIQGSAADQTKQALCDWDDSRKWSDEFLATVHDEVNISVPKEDVVGGMERLRAAMDADRFDVPFLSEGFTGENWQDISKYER